MTTAYRHHPIHLALVASLALHVAVYLAVMPSLETRQRSTPATVTQSIRFELLQRSPGPRVPDPVSPGREALPVPHSGPAQKRPAATVTGEREQSTSVGENSTGADLERTIADPKSAPAATVDLDLNLPPAATDTPDDPGPRLRGTVVDPNVAAKILRERATRTTRRPRGDVPAGRAVGGRWESFVEIDGLCFRVIERDPLDSLSTDQWFPVSCD